MVMMSQTNSEREKKKSDLDYCEKDYKNKHYWERIGIWQDEYILYKCSQCQKCKLHIIEFLTPSVEDLK